MTREEYLEMLRKNHKRMLLNKKRTSIELGISEATLDRLRKDGQISTKRVLGQVMFSIDEIARFLAD